jgi:tetratricopeptide (TPR) repeat protein
VPIDRLVAHGERLARAGDYRSAIGAYRAALEATPARTRRSATSAAVLTLLGDAAFRAGHHALAVRALEEVVLFGDLCPPLVYLRLGQARFERGELEPAADQLLRAHVLGRGAQEFADEDPKYLAFLLSRVDL